MASSARASRAFVPSSFAIVAAAAGLAAFAGMALHASGSCDGPSVTVPSPCYPTIQSAIDATPAGEHRTIDVLPGTYPGGIRFNGKNVVVRGAPGGATILDGTGISTSIVTFPGGEPSTAGIENLVLRHGITGQPITPPTFMFTGGGAVYGRNSSAFIRDCVIEDCRADFGGGAYLLYCDLDVSGTVFDGNVGNRDGGGMLAYRNTGAVRGCVFTSNRAGVGGPGSGSAFKAVGAGATGEEVLVDGCLFTGNVVSVSGSAIEYYQNLKSNPGVLRLRGTTVTANVSGVAIPSGAGGLRVLGGQSSCILEDATICGNVGVNVDGPYLIDGSATVCDCEADFTGNGSVDPGDLGVLLSTWGPAANDGLGDLNHDGLVNAADLGLLLTSWGPCS